MLFTVGVLLDLPVLGQGKAEESGTSKVERENEWEGEKKRTKERMRGRV